MRLSRSTRASVARPRVLSKAAFWRKNCGGAPGSPSAWLSASFAAGRSFKAMWLRALCSDTKLRAVPAGSSTAAFSKAPTAFSCSPSPCCASPSCSRTKPSSPGCVSDPSAFRSAWSAFSGSPRMFRTTASWSRRYPFSRSAGRDCVVSSNTLRASFGFPVS